MVDVKLQFCNRRRQPIIVPAKCTPVLQSIQTSTYIENTSPLSRNPPDHHSYLHMTRIGWRLWSKIHSTVSLAIPSEIPCHCDETVRYFIPRWICSHQNLSTTDAIRFVYIYRDKLTTLMFFSAKKAAKSRERSSYERYTTVFSCRVARNGNDDASHLFERYTWSSTISKNSGGFNDGSVLTTTGGAADATSDVSVIVTLEVTCQHLIWKL